MLAVILVCLLQKEVQRYDVVAVQPTNQKVFVVDCDLMILVSLGWIKMFIETKMQQNLYSCIGLLQHC